MEASSATRVVLQLACLAAGQVRVEHQSAGIQAFEQHHAHRGLPLAVGSRQRHGGGLDQVRLLSVREPLRKQPDRVVAYQVHH